MDRAQARAEALGCPGITAGPGAVLRLLAAVSHARAVVEIGTGAGISGLWLLRGMPTDGVLTTIDVEPEHQRAARSTFAEAEFRTNRTRVIAGRALEVLPRLSDAGYDLVLCDGDPAENPDYVEQAVRLLRPGGVLAIADALGHGELTDPAQRDPVTTRRREVHRLVREDSRLFPAVVPTGTGLILAVLR